MNGDFKNYTTKEKLAQVLLACLSWGCSPNWSQDIELKIQKRLKVQYTFDSWRIRSCIDLIEDTENAILSFSRYGLQKFTETSFKDFEEIYIRLYGVLNAVQQQKLAFFELFDTLKYREFGEAKGILENLKIMEIRNVVGAHTINLLDSGNHKPENFKTNFFRITQCQLTALADNIDAVDGFGNIRNYNMYESIMEYNRVSEKILYDAVIDYMNRIFKNCLNKKTEFLEHYEIETFIPFDYSRLYQNDIAAKKYYKKINKELEKDLKKEYGENWKDIIQEEINKMTIEDIIETQMIYLKQKNAP